MKNVLVVRIHKTFFYTSNLFNAVQYDIRLMYFELFQHDKKIFNIKKEDD